MKTVVKGLIGVGILLVVIAIVMFGAFAVRVFGSFTKGGQAQYAQVGAKIATFTLPPGYRFRSAFDMMFLDEVIIEPVAPHRDFLIAMQGLTNDAGPDTQTSALKAIVSGLDPEHTCKPATTPSEDLTTGSGKTLEFSRLQCTRNGKPKIIEYARMPSKLPLGILAAYGSVDGFDRGALVALTKSMR